MFNTSKQTHLKHLTAIVVGLGLAVLIGCSGGESSKEPASPGSSKETKKTEPPAKALTAEEILERMVAAYKQADTYTDKGTVTLDFVINGQPQKERQPFSLTYTKPNKLKLLSNTATIYCDGRELCAEIEDIPDFVVKNPAPKKLTLDALFVDRVLAEAWAGGFGDIMPQVLFIFGKTPLKDLTDGVKEITLLKPGEIDGKKYHLVQMVMPTGLATFWIDQKTFVLRRLVMPTNDIRRELEQYGRVDSVSRVADFLGAEFNADIPADTFVFNPPKNAKVMKYFPPGPIRMIGKKIPKLSFVDLDGKPVELQPPTGKIIVLDFWATWCGPCMASLPHFDQLRKKFKDNPKVAFYAVSVDDMQTDNDKLVKTFEQLKVAVPILRDPEQTAAELKFIGIPTLFLIGPEGIVQDCVMGGDPASYESVAKKIDVLLAGKSVYQESFADFMKTYSMMLEAQAAATEEASDGRTTQTQEIPRVEIAPKSEPTKLKLAPLWKCDEVKSPGNILPVREKDGRTRLFVVENWSSVTEVGPDGKRVKTYDLQLAPGGKIGSLRTGIDGDGRRYYVAYILGSQRCHIYDENWQPVAHYPENALKNPHSGISDVALGDLDGDGKLNLYVSYWGLVGVQGVSLDGKRLWANRSLNNVQCIVVGAADAQGFSNLYCAAGGITLLDSKGKQAGKIEVPGRAFNWIAKADLFGDGMYQWCGMSAFQTGDNTLVGFLPDGREMWNYALPKGTPTSTIEPIISGRVSRDGPARWIAPGVDGSIHIVSPDGTLYDKFNYGTVLLGLAAVEIDGRPVLLVSTINGVEAWKVE